MADGRRLEERRRRASASFGREAQEREVPLFENDLPLWTAGQYHGAASPGTADPERQDTTRIFGPA